MFCRISRNRLKASVCRFPLNRSGSTAMTFDVAILPLLAGAGVAIDFARIATKHTSLQQATDAAALAIAQSATASTTNADVMAQAYLDELFRTATITLATISSDHTSVCVNAQDTVQLGIMSMFNIRSKSVEASTCTTIAGGEQLRNRARPRQFRLDERVGERKFENRRAAHGRHQFRQHHVQCSFHRQGENVDRAVCWPCLGFLRRHVERICELDRYAGQVVLALEDVFRRDGSGLHQSPQHFQKSEERLGLGRLLRDSAIPAERQRYASDERDARYPLCALPRAGRSGSEANVYQLVLFDHTGLSEQLHQ